MSEYINVDTNIDLLPNTESKSLYNGLGFVELIDMMPRIVPQNYTADLSIARNARVSYAQNTAPTPANAERLVRYLMEHWHTSPSESVVFQFRIKMPIFVSRHIDRYRTARANYESGRYVCQKNEFYLPNLRMQNKDNKQCSDNRPIPNEAEEIWKSCESDLLNIYKKYDSLLTLGVAKEVARCILPLSLMTTCMWQMDLHNLLHFLQQRLASDAQQETRELAEAIFSLISNLVPISIKAFQDFQLNQISVNGEELNYLQGKSVLSEKKKTLLDKKLVSLNQHNIQK